MSAQVTIPDGHYKVETNAHPIIVCNVLPADVPGPFNTITLGAVTYTFQPSVGQLLRNTEYTVTDGTTTYRLFFSGLAIVDIAVDQGFNAINAGTEIRANMWVTDTVGTTFHSLMAIRHRGASSLSYSKKSYRVQLKDDDFRNKNESIFGLRSDRRWLLLALYNERLRINNKVCHDLWLDMHKLYYLDQEPDALSTIRSRYVLVFIDNTYRGMYLFTEDTDAKQYKLVEDQVNTEDKDYGGGERRYTGGELYKGDDNGAPNFFNSPYSVPGLPAFGSEIWAGWEIKHPSRSDWVTLREFSRYVRDRNESLLQAEIWSSLHKGNFIDYYLFINLVYAEDNLGKNLFMARYKKDEPYFYGVWDLDGTLGFQYHSGRNPRGQGFIGNQFWSKLMQNNDDLKDEMAVRWFTLRRNLLSEEQILGRIQKHYDYLASNGAYRLESLAQSRTPVEVEHGGWDRTWLNYSSSELAYMKNFMTTRLETMDRLIQPWLTSPLPVSLMSFTAKRSENRVELVWQTATERNSGRFEIEHSRDAAVWRRAGEVMAGGDVATHSSYTFQHVPSGSGMHYYRLKMIDNDGSYEFSGIQSVAFEGGRRVAIFPNPARGVLHVRTVGDVKAEKLSLYDLLGREVLQKKIETSGADHTLDLHNLEGLFLLRSQFDDGSESVLRVLVEQ